MGKHFELFCRGLARKTGVNRNRRLENVLGVIQCNVVEDVVFLKYTFLYKVVHRGVHNNSSTIYTGLIQIYILLEITPSQKDQLRSSSLKFTIFEFNRKFYILYFIFLLFSPKIDPDGDCFRET